MLRQSHAEARRLISGVRPPILDESGIVAAIAHLVNDEHRGPRPKIEFHSKVAFSRLAPVVEDSIYRIVQEKMYMIGAAVTGGYTALALIMALNSAIAGYYYLKLIVYMFMKDPIMEDGGHIYSANATLPLKTIIGIASIGTIFAF